MLNLVYPQYIPNIPYFTIVTPVWTAAQNLGTLAKTIEVTERNMANQQYHDLVAAKNQLENLRKRYKINCMKKPSIHGCSELQKKLQDAIAHEDKEREKYAKSKN